MGRMTLKGTTAFEMYGNYFKICQEFWICEPDNEEYWEKLYKAMDWFMTRYREEPYADRMIMSFLEWKEAEAREALKQKFMKGETV